MKAKELKNKIHTIKLKDGYHNLIFDMNVMAEIEEVYGGIEAGLEMFKTRPMKSILVYIWAFLKQEEKYENISQKDAGQLMDLKLLQDYQIKIQKSINEAMGTSEPNKIEEETKNGEESPNV
jgi:hypothetical protein